ncbi:PDZ domain-containing protein [Clostridium rectalis]|uniref:PDZ domain-containing protein n=1 Tax=Clostridium rectalis TaxID=2040295 RepID=UPI000F63FFB2|nr:PDZ domain-containing protein [Clostridium rectalis]
MNIIIHTLRVIAFALTEPYFVLFLFILAVILYKQNRKTSAMQRMIIGEQVNSPFELTVSQVVMGIFAGVIASVIMTCLGVVFYENSMIEILFLTSILLMVWSPRFMCFSYSAAILGGISIINSFISGIYGTTEVAYLKFNITSLMTMVAVLHFVEGLLVIFDGNRGSVPVFTKREDKIIGGFIMKRYWALPIAIIMLYNMSSLGGDVTGTTPTPNWWPILNGTISTDMLKNTVLLLVPFYGVLGYNSVTFTRDKTGKVVNSGLFIILYSIILFILAQLANLNIFFKILVVLFAPIGHEIMLYIQRVMEIKRKPKYVSDEGIMILDTAPSSYAYELGIRSGDSIIQINDEDIDTDSDAINILTKIHSNIKIKLKKKNGEIKEIIYKYSCDKRKLGMVFVPKSVPEDKTVLKFTENTFTEILNKVKNRNKDGEE